MLFKTLGVCKYKAGNITYGTGQRATWSQLSSLDIDIIHLLHTIAYGMIDLQIGFSYWKIWDTFGTKAI